MYPNWMNEASFYEMLERIDRDLAQRAREARCRCGGRLDSARYPRKPRGGPSHLSPGYDWRLSFCCALEGCRRRVTPPSVRYLGRRVYLGCVVVLVMAMEQGITLRRLARLHAHLGVGLRTLRRWRQWWQEGFVATRFWRHARGRFMPPVDECELPRTLLERFGGEPASKLLSLLVFLTPLTTTSGKT